MKQKTTEIIAWALVIASATWAVWYIYNSDKWCKELYGEDHSSYITGRGIFCTDKDGALKKL